MKNILYSLFAVLALLLVSCDNKAGLPGPGDPVNVAAEVAGVYTGTWTRVLDSDPNNVVTADGTLTLTQVNDQFYVVNVAADCADIALTAQANANINPRYVFFNALSSEFGNKFAGKITEGNNISMDFSLTIKEGRKQYVYNYNFSGIKN